MKSSKNDTPTDQNNSGRIDSPSEDPSDDVSISRTWASIHRGQLRQSLQIFAIVAVAILLLAMLHQVVVEAYSQFEDKVEPVSGIDWHIPYGETETVDNETIAVTGDIIVEGTLIINDSLVYMSSIDPAVVNKIDVKPLIKKPSTFMMFIHHCLSTKRLVLI